jgi:hypothetical protein
MNTFIFYLNVFSIFTITFLKMVPIGVRFSPGNLSGAGFPGEKFAPAWSRTPEVLFS